MQIKIKDSLSDYIESLQYEKNRTNEIMAFMLGHDYDMDTDTFKKWDKENQIVYFKYERAKEQLEKEYIRTHEELKDKKINWSLDFDTKILTCEVL